MGQDFALKKQIALSFIIASLGILSDSVLFMVYSLLYRQQNKYKEAGIGQ